MLFSAFSAEIIAFILRTGNPYSPHEERRKVSFSREGEADVMKTWPCADFSVIRDLLRILSWCKPVFLRSAHLTRVFSEFPSSHQYDCVDGMRQRNDVCRNAKRGALNSRHARLPNLTLRYRAGSAVVHLTTTPRLVPSHPSPRVKSYHGVLVRRPKNFQNSSTRRPRRKCPRAQNRRK